MMLMLHGRDEPWAHYPVTKSMKRMRLMPRAPVATASLVDDPCFVAAAMSAAAPPPGYLPEK
jgi:hypothetical protein